MKLFLVEMTFNEYAVTLSGQLWPCSPRLPRASVLQAANRLFYNARDLRRRAPAKAKLCKLLLDGNEPGLPPRNSPRFKRQREGQVARQCIGTAPSLGGTSPRHRADRPIPIDKWSPSPSPGPWPRPCPRTGAATSPGAMTNTHALRGTSPMSGPDIQAAYKEYERSFDELSQASAASPPLFRRRWGDGSVEDDDVSVLTAPVVHQQRRPSQRELERELVRADVAGRVTDHNSTATAITRRAPDERSVVSGASTASAFEVQRQGPPRRRREVPRDTSGPRPRQARRRRAGALRAGAGARPAARDSVVSVVCRLGLGRLGAGAGVPRRGRCGRPGLRRHGGGLRRAELETLRRRLESRSRRRRQNRSRRRRRPKCPTSSAATTSIATAATSTVAPETASPSKSHIFGDALSVSTTMTSPARVTHVRARAGAGRAVTCADLAAFQGDATHLERAVEERSVAFAAALKANGRRAPPRFGRCLTPEDALLPRTLRRAIKRTSPPKQRKSALPSPVASPPARRPAPTGAYVRPVPTRDGVRSLLKTFPRHWTDIAEHTNWGRPEPVRKDVVLRVDKRPGVDPTTYRTHHLRRPDAHGVDHLLILGEPGVKVSFRLVTFFRLSASESR